MSDDDATTKNPGELRDLFRQIAQPVLTSVDNRLRDQIDKRVDERVTEKVSEILTDRLAVIERALADLDRTVRDLQDKMGRAD